MAVKQREKGVAGKGTGEIFRVAGPVVTATGLRPRMYDVQFVGEEQLLGEVIQIMGDKTVIQVYEDTSGVKPGEVVLDTGAPLVVELGPSDVPQRGPERRPEAHEARATPALPARGVQAHERVHVLAQGRGGCRARRPAGRRKAAPQAAHRAPEVGALGGHPLLEAGRLERRPGASEHPVATACRAQAPGPAVR